MGTMISVIVPVYNVRDYMDDCIEAIINQTYSDWEMILVDDGSEDDSGERCDEYAKLDSRIRVIHQKNQGLAAARNTGINHAEGKYIAFCDSDDMFNTSFLEIMVKTAEQENADIVCCDINKGETPDWAVKSEEIIIRRGRECFSKLYINDGIVNVVWNKLYRREIFDSGIRFKPGTLYEDMQIMPRILYTVNTMVLIPDNLYFYRQRKGSITKQGSFNRKRLDLIDVVEERMNFFSETGEKKLFYIELEGYLRKLIRYRKKMDKYDYRCQEDRKNLEEKLKVTLRKYLFDPKLPLKIKIKSIIARMEFLLKR